MAPGTTATGGAPVTQHDGPAPLTLDDLLDDQRDLHRIQRAREVGRLMRRLGWVVAAIGVAALISIVVFWISGDITADEAVEWSATLVMSTILAGVAAYGSGMGLTLAASNLARRLQQVGVTPEPLESEPEER